MLYNFIFYFLIFLNFCQPILSTNLFEKIDKFHEIFVVKFEEFGQKLNAISGKENLKNHKFGNAMFKKGFPMEIMKIKVEVEKYMERKITFEVIFDAMNNLKLEGNKLEALKELQMEIKNALKREQNGQKHKATSKQLDLVNFLIEMHELVNEFVDDIILELRIRQPINNFLKNLANHLKEQKAEFTKPYEIFVKKYSHIFPKIEKLIKRAKEILQKEYKKPNPPLPIISPEEAPSHLKENWEILMEAIFNPSNPLLEKVKLNEPNEWNNDYLSLDNINISLNFVKISALLDKSVDQLLKAINEYFKIDQKREFASLHVKMDDLQSLNIACHKMLNRIEQLVNRNANGIEQSCYLADMNWLAEFIEEKLTKMNGAIHGPIYNIDIATVAGELPKELKISAEMEPKERAILIGQNMLFIAAQLRKWHNLEDAIFDTYMEFPIKSHKVARLNEMITKDLPSQQIDEFFYQKYGEIIKKGGNESKVEMSISANSSGPSFPSSANVRGYEHIFGSNSSANLGGNKEEEEDKKKGKEPWNRKEEKNEEGLNPKFLIKSETSDMERI